MREKTKESIKTVILIILFLTTVFLLYLLWPENSNGLSIFTRPSSQVVETQNLEISEVITPYEIEIINNDGSIDFAKDKKSVFKKCTDQIFEMCNENESAIAIVSKVIYQEAKEGFQSLTLKFGYDISFSDFSSYMNLKTGSNFDVIENFDTIMYSAAYKSSIFLYSSKTDEYFRLAGKNYYFSITDLLENAELDSKEYIKASEIMGIGDNFIPYAVEEKINAAYVESKTLLESEQESFARYLFGKSFDFARKVVDTVGNTTFMYGYGQKVLKINKNGELEYRAELSEKKNTSMLEDIAKANELISSLSLEKLYGFDFELKNIELVSGEKSVIRRLEYNQCYNNLDIETFEDPSLIIEIENGEIVYLKINALCYKSSYDLSSDVYEPARMLAENCAFIYQSVKNEKARNNEDAYTFVCENVESIKQIYVLENGNKVSPRWQVNILGEKLYYNYY